MENLLSLPVDLLKGRLFGFLSIVDVARLDEAVQNRETRPHFIEGLTSSTFSKAQDVLGHRDKLIWLHTRKVHCSYLEFGFDVSDDDFHKYRQALEKTEHVSLRCSQKFTTAGLAYLLKHAKALTTIELHNCTNIGGEDTKLPPNRLKKLRFLNCRSLFDSHFCAIVEQLPHLEVLDISGCVHLTETVVEAIAAYCSELREFYCNDMPWETFTAESLTLISDCCPKFETLVCDGLHLLDDQLVGFAEHCPDLMCLELGECQNLSDETVIELSKHCDQLHTFVVDYCDISDAAVIALLHYCGGTLTTFSIDSASEVTSDSLSAIATQCSALTSLHLGNFPECSTDALLEIVSSSSALHTLELPGCDMMTDAVLHRISTCCVYLTTLDISEVSGFTDEALMMLFKSCTKLESVSMNHMVVKDCVLQQLGASCKMLHTLSLISSVITTNGLVELSTHCTTLTTLRIPDTFVDDVGVVSILSRNPYMVDLNICGCNVADVSMQTLSVNCTKLRRLYMDRCPLVTAAGFMNVATHCTQLRELWANEGNFVVNSTITTLVEHCRYLEILRVQKCTKLTNAVLPVLERCHYLRRAEFNECGKGFKLASAKFKNMILVFRGQVVFVDTKGEESVFLF